MQEDFPPTDYLKATVRNENVSAVVQPDSEQSASLTPERAQDLSVEDRINQEKGPAAEFKSTVSDKIIKKLLARQAIDIHNKAWRKKTERKKQSGEYVADENPEDFDLSEEDIDLLSHSEWTQYLASALEDLDREGVLDGSWEEGAFTEAYFHEDGQFSAQVIQEFEQNETIQRLTPNEMVEAQAANEAVKEIIHENLPKHLREALDLAKISTLEDVGRLLETEVLTKDEYKEIVDKLENDLSKKKEIKQREKKDSLLKQLALLGLDFLTEGIMDSSASDFFSILVLGAAAGKNAAYNRWRQSKESLGGYDPVTPEKLFAAMDNRKESRIQLLFEVFGEMEDEHDFEIVRKDRDEWKSIALGGDIDKQKDYLKHAVDAITDPEKRISANTAFIEAMNEVLDEPKIGDHLSDDLVKLLGDISTRDRNFTEHLITPDEDDR